jgi:hypothetical protein
LPTYERSHGDGWTVLDTTCYAHNPGVYEIGARLGVTTNKILLVMLRAAERWGRRAIARTGAAPAPDARGRSAGGGGHGGDRGADCGGECLPARDRQARRLGYIARQVLSGGPRLGSLRVAAQLAVKGATSGQPSDPGEPATSGAGHPGRLGRGSSAARPGGGDRRRPARSRRGPRPGCDHQPRTFVVTLTAGSGSVPIAARAFTLVDDQHRIHHPRVRPANGEPLPSTLPPHTTLSLSLHAVLPAGDGGREWAPDGGRPVVAWDFVAETD